MSGEVRVSDGSLVRTTKRSAGFTPDLWPLNPRNRDLVCETSGDSFDTLGRIARFQIYSVTRLPGRGSRRDLASAHVLNCWYCMKRGQGFWNMPWLRHLWYFSKRYLLSLTFIENEQWLCWLKFSICIVRPKGRRLDKTWPTCIGTSSWIRVVCFTNLLKCGHKICL